MFNKIYETKRKETFTCISKKVFCLLIKINKLTLYGWWSILKSFETFSKSKVFCEVLNYTFDVFVCPSVIFKSF